MAIDRRALAAWLASIRDILNRSWDPIGDSAKNEYDKYMNDLASLIHIGATNEELLSYLEWAEGEILGLASPFDRIRGHKVIAALRALGPPQHLH
jgi:hypothetical protein